MFTYTVKYSFKQLTINKARQVAQGYKIVCFVKVYEKILQHAFFFYNKPRTRGECAWQEPATIVRAVVRILQIMLMDCEFEAAEAFSQIFIDFVSMLSF